MLTSSTSCLALLLLLLLPSALCGDNSCHPHFVYSEEAAAANPKCSFPPVKWSSLSDWCQDVPVNRPSPINLKLGSCVSDPWLREIKLSGSWSVGSKFSVKNNGHSVQATALSSDLTVSGGNLNGKYTVVQFHFHWGSASNMRKGVGSEHVMFSASGRRVKTPAEVHVVCRRSDLSFGEAASSVDGIAVLGAFFGTAGASNKKANAALKQLIGNTDAVATPSSAGKTVSLRLRDLLPNNIRRFVNYDGAFTTPKCNPVVQWHIFPQVVGVKKRTLRKFTKTFFDTERKEPMENNFRPVMGNHGRVLRCRSGSN